MLHVCAYAQEESRPPKALDLLENALGELDPEENPSKGNLADRDALLREIGDLQETLGLLQEVLDEKILGIRQLEDENEKLRQALRLRFGRSGEGLPPVPMPNRDLLESVLREPAPFTEREEILHAQTPEVEAYTVVNEWGRSPQVAASLPGDVASLVGMAIAVPPEMSEDALVQLGRELRENYDAYDNINIEVFDDVDSARAFADAGKTNARHRRISVSKFKHSERDSITLFRNGKAVSVQ